jgi:HTH-type transcriptional regulator/antitoxin HigA
MAMDIRAIQTEADYDWALAEVTPYFESEPELGSPASDRFMVLTTLIEAYENKHWKIEAPDPIDAINLFIEQHNRTRAELVALLGSQSRVSEVLNRKRRLTLPMVHKLATHWHLPAEILVRPYHLDQER